MGGSRRVLRVAFCDRSGSLWRHRWRWLGWHKTGSPLSKVTQHWSVAPVHRLGRRQRRLLGTLRRGGRG